MEIKIPDETPAMKEALWDGELYRDRARVLVNDVSQMLSMDCIDCFHLDQAVTAAFRSGFLAGQNAKPS